MKKDVQLALLVLTSFLLISLFWTSIFQNQVNAQNQTNALAPDYVKITYSRIITREEHIFLNSLASVTYNASSIPGGWKLTQTHVQLDSPNRPALRQIQTDLYVETFDYYGGNMGAWTSQNNFTLTNPTNETMELFLKIEDNYVRIEFTLDQASGNNHSFTFTTSVPADKVTFNWNFIAILESIKINGTQYDPGLISSSRLPILMEFVSYGVNFHFEAPAQVETTSFEMQLDESQAQNHPQTTPYIGAWIFQHHDLVLAPHQTAMFDAPNLQGWTYSNGIIGSNITLSKYLSPFPFRLINLAVWDPQATPVLATPTNTTFGIENLSDQTYAVTFDPTIYYWENQTGLTYTKQITNTTNQIIQSFTVNVTNAKVGTELGLNGQYLIFPNDGTTVQYEAPDQVGKFFYEYIPLKEGNYNLVMTEPKLTINLTTGIDDLNLTSTLKFNVTFEGDPYPGAIITVHKAGTFSNADYTQSTDVEGHATFIVKANIPETETFQINITKEGISNFEKTVAFTVGLPLLLIAAALASIILVALLLFWKRRKKRDSSLKHQKGR